MLTIFIFIVLWYIVGLISTAYALKFNLTKIKNRIGLYLFMSLFGLVITAIIIFDDYIEKDQLNK